MRKRTWDILAKYVSEEMGITVNVSDECEGPRIQLDTKTIELPSRIKEQNALAALSTLIHEAAHMKWSTIIPNGFAKTKVDHYIVNAMEDVRIDKKNFQLLPNIWDFYEKYIKEHLCSRENKEAILKQHMLTRSMIFLIMDNTAFGRYVFDPDARDFVYDKRMYIPFNEGIDAIERRDWNGLRQSVDEIKSHFNIKEEQGDDNGQGQGEGTGDPKDCSGSGRGSGNGQASSSGNNDGDGSSGQSAGAKGNASESDKDKQEIKDPENLVRPASLWSKGPGLKGPGGLDFNPVEFAENTKQRFINALNVKERCIRADGQKINLDNLTAFFTGDLEELFMEEDIETVKKSKIVFCLDASGSMGCQLFDKTYRQETLGRCVKTLVDILDEVRETEGLNVDYDIIAFESHPHLLDKTDWEERYRMISGGTNIYRAVDKAVEVLSNDDIDGNKIIILVTDGEVSGRELDLVKDLMIKHNSDIKAMLLGIGASKSFIKMCGDNNIICLEHADQIIMEAIQQMLET